MKLTKSDDVRGEVRGRYAKIAAAGGTGCGCGSSACCGTPINAKAADIAVGLGYSEKDVKGAPEGANMGLGCGNPQAIAALRPGETVLDLGSGGGFDCFLAAKAVGGRGFVVGVDMTPEMVSSARRNAEKAGLGNVEFRLGEIENIPAADGMFDVVISNCVINLSPEKSKVFSEIFRVLKSGGRLAVSDVVRTAEMPEEMKKNPALYSGCIAGAASPVELRSMLERAGFVNISITPKNESGTFIREWAPGSGAENFVVSAAIEAEKPGA